jgi:hypothetical protein
VTNAPAQPPIPSDGTDDLGLAVLNALSRPIARKQTPRLLPSAVLALITFGIAPVLRWGRRYVQFVTLEQQQFWHLAEWLRLRLRTPEAAELPDEANRLRPRPVLMVLSVLCVVAVVFEMIHQLRITAMAWYPLMHSTYLFASEPRGWARHAFAFWVIGLSLAYALHWVQVKLHAVDRELFLQKLDRAWGQGTPPMAAAPVGFGLRPLWLIAALGFVALGAWWGVPMMLAGALQRTEIMEASLRDRQALARRLHAMLQNRQPGVAMPVYLRRLCENEFCRTKLPEAASFCPRCGRRAAGPMHRVA